MSGAEGVIESLQRAGIRGLFVDPAAGQLPSPEFCAGRQVRLLYANLAGSASIMADAAARATGQPGACLLAQEGGFFRSAGLLRLSRIDSVPLVALVLAENVAEPELGLAGVCKGLYQIEAPEEIPPVLAQAVQLARDGEPGPVLVRLSRGALSGCGWMRGTGFRQGPRPLEEEAQKQLDRLVEWLEEAEQVAIYAGAGCLDAGEELQQLCEKLAAPLATTISGAGALPFQHPLAAGYGPPPTGWPLADEAFSGSRLVLAVGCKPPPETLSQLPDCRTVLIDTRPQAPAGEDWFCVCAPIKPALRYLLERVPFRTRPELQQQLLEGKKRLRKVLAGLAAGEGNTELLSLQVFVELRELLAAEDFLLLDSGRQAACALAAFMPQQPRGLLLPVGAGLAGWSIPAAVAVSALFPERRVVACVGEGSFTETAFELLSARRCDLAPVVVVFSPSAPERLPSVGRLVARETVRELAPVNLENAAHALDCAYFCAAAEDELAAALRGALTAERPALVELKLRYPEIRLMEKLARSDGALPRGLWLRLAARALHQQLLA